MAKRPTKPTRRERHQPAAELALEARLYAESIVDTVREPLLVLDADLRVKSANRSFYRAFQVRPEETENRLVYELGDGQWDIPALRTLLEEVLPENTHFDDFEVEHEFPTIGARTMLLNARRIHRGEAGTQLILLAIEDITERRRAARQHTEMNAFIYSVSHDFKEPLRTVEGFSRFVLEDYGDRLDEKGREYLTKLSEAGGRMNRLMDDLVTLARVGEGSNHLTPVDVGRMVLEIVEGMRITSEEKEATVEVEDGMPEVLIDRGRLEQIFANLIGNALKFNESEEPVVKVGVRAVENGTATFYVQDNGLGIDPQYHERVFGMFERLHRREEYGGTGAGLAIVKHAAEAAGGQVWVESELGAGAIFLFTLPLRPKAGHSAERNAA